MIRLSRKFAMQVQLGDYNEENLYLFVEEEDEKDGVTTSYTRGLLISEYTWKIIVAHSSRINMKVKEFTDKKGGEWVDAITSKT